MIISCLIDSVSNKLDIQSTGYDEDNEQFQGSTDYYIFLFIIHNATRSAVLLASQSAKAEFKYLANFATL
jgi:hypothetical protein